MKAAATPDAAGPQFALTDVGSHLRIWIVAASGLALDLWSKGWAFHSLRQNSPPRVLIPHVLELQTMLNPGALFGIGAGQTAVFVLASVLALGLVVWMFAQSSPRRWALQLALGAILAGALGNMYDRIFVKLIPQVVRTDRGPARLYFVKTGQDANAEIMLREYPADVPGLELTIPDPNHASLRDEVGYVRDFIKIPTKLPWFGGRDLWPWVFNVADALLVCGVAILAFQLWRDRRRRAAGQGPDPS